MKDNVKNGKYLLGDLIQPKTYEKFQLDKNGNIITSSYTVSGRKIPLNMIRRNIYEEHNKLRIIRPQLDNTLNRNFIVWADHASVLNSGFLLYTTKVICSKDIFYTDDEMKSITGNTVDVEKLVEQPSIYIFAKTSDSIAEKLMYVEARMEDIGQLNIPLKTDDNVILQYTMRFYQGKEETAICTKN